MRKGEKTRDFIIRQAAVLFNQKGYFGSSISDLSRVTGMQKGSIESDDALPSLKEKTKMAMENFLELIRSLLRMGIEQGEFKEETEVQEMAIYITSVIEGGVMLSRLYEDNTYIRSNINRLLREIETYRMGN
ncbi:TetR family transcriptional regulator C-terminal domain-containing protein [Paenibacillus harenae]|uniref:Tetracyclin repressor-like C-terminal domain-containing protein n=1 Tax=Paenibacillus harenae TaxID=306543 RepID=A0ABT9U2I0_PAEHA|nr:hypothetical protein [Paenibacillus harenae]MDQ0113836.1 hypothetical protein [Paenibacillus harenae]